MTGDLSDQYTLRVGMLSPASPFLDILYPRQVLEVLVLRPQGAIESSPAHVSSPFLS